MLVTLARRYLLIAVAVDDDRAALSVDCRAWWSY